MASTDIIIYPNAFQYSVGISLEFFKLRFRLDFDFWVPAVRYFWFCRFSMKNVFSFGFFMLVGFSAKPGPPCFIDLNVWHGVYTTQRDDYYNGQ